METLSTRRREQRLGFEAYQHEIRFHQYALLYADFDGGKLSRCDSLAEDIRDPEKSLPLRHV